jgi:hypothetical protein
MFRRDDEWLLYAYLNPYRSTANLEDNDFIPLTTEYVAH